MFYTEGYRFGFNGKEYDETLKFQDYGARAYSAKYCRFWTVDPLTTEYAFLTPYQFASNRPIDGIDRDGLEFEPGWATSAIQKQQDYEKELRKENPEGANDIIYQKNKEAAIFVGGALGPLTRAVSWFGIISFASNHHVGDNLRRSGKLAEAQKYYNSGNADGLPIFLGMGFAKLLGFTIKYGGNLLPEIEVKGQFEVRRAPSKMGAAGAPNFTISKVSKGIDGDIIAQLSYTGGKYSNINGSVNMAEGVFEVNIAALKHVNATGYGKQMGGGTYSDLVGLINSIEGEAKIRGAHTVKIKGYGIVNEGLKNDGLMKLIANRMGYEYENTTIVANNHTREFIKKLKP